MSQYEHMLISKILDTGNIKPLTVYSLSEVDFTVCLDVYKFLMDYSRQYNGIPDFRTVVEKFEKFEYYAEVVDSFKFLCKELKMLTAKRLTYEILQDKTSEKFKNLNGLQFLNWLQDELNKVETLTTINVNAGSNYAFNGKERLERYKFKKLHKDKMFIVTPFTTLTDGLGGGLALSDYVLLTAFTNKGKSWIASLFGLVAFNNAFNVLHYSPELSLVQQEERLDTLQGHFNNMCLKNASLTESSEVEYFEFLKGYSEELNYRRFYSIKTPETLIDGLTVEVVEKDIESLNPHLVIIDGFNLMVHSKGKSLRNSMSITSRRLKQLLSRFNVTGLIVHHVGGKDERDNLIVDEVGNKILKCPELHQYSETVAVVQDADTVITYDYADGKGKLKVVKARATCVGLEIDLLANYNMGYITEHTVKTVPNFNP